MTCRHLRIRAAFALSLPTLVALTLATGARADGGDLDDTFGGDGTATLTEPDGIIRSSDPSALARARQGRLWVGMTVYNSPPFSGEVILTRLLEDGTYDDAFSQDGQRTWRLPGGKDSYTSVSAVRASGAGVEIVGRYFVDDDTSPYLYVAAFRGHGALDDSYGEGGYVKFRLPPGSLSPDDSALDQSQVVASSADGRYLCALTNGERKLRVWSLLADGSPNPEFGDVGSVVLDHDPFYRQLNGCGTATTGGPIIFSSGNRDMLEFIRLTEDGTPDGEYGDGGQALLRVVDVTARVPAFLADGSIAIAGVTSREGSTRPSVLKIRSDGTLDTDYGDGDGLAVGTAAELKNVFDYQGGQGSNIAVRANGRIATAGVVQGGFGHRPYVAMFTADGQPASDFGGDGGVTRFLTTDDEIPSSAIFDGRGRLLIGAEPGFQDRRSEVARFVR